MERVDLQKLSVLIWSWQNRNLDFVEFTPEENFKINEGVKFNKETIDLGDRTVKISTKIVFEKNNPEITSKIKSLAREYAIPTLLTKPDQINDFIKEKNQKNQKFKASFDSNNRKFFYASLFGVLRAADITKTNLIFGEIISKRSILFSTDLDFYPQIINDPDFENSLLYEEFLAALQEMEYNSDRKPPSDNLMNFSILDDSLMTEIFQFYHRNHSFFSENSKNQSPLLDPFLWMVNLCFQMGDRSQGKVFL